MKKIFFYLLALAWIATSTAMAVSNWEQLSIDGQMSLEFPGTPVQEQSTRDTLMGEIVEKRYTADVKQGHFTASSSNVHRSALLFIGGREGLYKRVWSELDSRLKVQSHTIEKCQVVGYDAWDVTFTDSDGKSGRALVVFDGDYLLVLVAQADKESTSRFISSLKKLNAASTQ